jgi:aminoglycoside 6'-N-acetyltransferase I
MTVTIREARPADREPLAAMRHALWPDGPAEEHANELDAILAGEWSGTYPYVVLVAEADGALIGFADVTLRSRAEGCDPTRPAGYLEGWYVAEAHRRNGVGAALMRAAEDWARAQGCREMASDTWLDNELSQRAHESLGYEEADRCVHYRKTL